MQSSLRRITCCRERIRQWGHELVHSRAERHRLGAHILHASLLQVGTGQSAMLRWLRVILIRVGHISCIGFEWVQKERGHHIKFALLEERYRFGHATIAIKVPQQICLGLWFGFGEEQAGGGRAQQCALLIWLVHRIWQVQILIVAVFLWIEWRAGCGRILVIDHELRGQVYNYAISIHVEQAFGRLLMLVEFVHIVHNGVLISCQ